MKKILELRFRPSESDSRWFFLFFARVAFPRSARTDGNDAHVEKEGREEVTDPGSERAKKQGGAALGRVRGRVSRRTAIRGVGGRVRSGATKMVNRGA